MPELPEVQTTVNGLRERIVGLTISDAWSDYDSPYFKGCDNIKDPAYFRRIKTLLIGAKVMTVSRRAKNVLIHLKLASGISNNVEKILLVHMKMTGHLLYGKYSFNKKSKKDPWIPVEPISLKDPYNRRVHFVISFSNKKQLALSDTRKFAKVTLIDANTIHHSDHIKGIGPEPLDKSFTFSVFKQRLMLKPRWNVKQTLMEQKIIAGIGNIYADESLWRSGLHPLQRVNEIPEHGLKSLYVAIKQTLSHGIDFGGDSMSDYRNVDGEKGSFQEKHRAYQRTGEKCTKKGCDGSIIRIVVGSRGTHLCDRHQKLMK